MWVPWDGGNVPCVASDDSHLMPPPPAKREWEGGCHLPDEWPREGGGEESVLDDERPVNRVGGDCQMSSGPVRRGEGLVRGREGSDAPSPSGRGIAPML
eukprot:1172307-Prorocentrum_minimum.AAC.1